MKKELKPGDKVTYNKKEYVLVNFLDKGKKYAVIEDKDNRFSIQVKDIRND